MICRLCLITVNVENKVSLFNGCVVDGGSQMVKLIAKYFLLEVTQHDPVSTTICQNCCNHLDEFHNFCTYVEGKQHMLRNEFLGVKCDAELHTAKPGVSVNAGQTVDESLCEIKDVLEEPIGVQLKNEPLVEQNIFEETTPFEDLQEDPTQPADENESSDDDLPLIELRRKTKFKVKPNEPLKIKLSKKLKSTKIQRRTRKPSPSDYSDSNTDGVTNVEEDCGAENPKPASASKPKQAETKYREKCFLQPVEDVDAFIIKNIQLKCDLCDDHFQKFYDLRTHFKEQHHQNEYVVCCGVRHNKRRDLYEHIKWHLDPDHFKCGECGKLMKNRNCLKMHKMTKHQNQEDLIFNCELCAKRFARPSLLNNHMKTTHATNRNFKCQHCNKSFSLKHALKKHVQSMHDNVFRHVCDVCGMKFKFKPSFENHVLEHQGIIAPPVKCHICGEWIKNKDRLRLHLASHNKVDVHCKYCGRVCASLSAMRGHIQYMHRRPPKYKCTYCEKFFKTPKILKEHVATHTGENLYSCPYCTKECRSSANMYVHIKRLHTQEWLRTQVERSTPDKWNKI